MKIRKEELPALLFWKYGKCEGEEERAQEYIREIKGTELELSTEEFFKLIEDMLNYVWGQHTEEDEVEEAEEEAEEEVEEGTEEEKEGARKFVYNFFFNW